MPIIRGIICEGCGEMIYWCGNVSKESATRYARKKGWTIGKRCLCAECKGRKNGNGGMNDEQTDTEG